MARVSVVADGAGNLGEVRHGKLADTVESLLFLLAGEAGEIAIFGDASAGNRGDMRKARAIAERIAKKQGGNADDLIEQARQRAIDGLRREQRLVKQLAFALIRHKTLDFEKIDQVLDEASTAVEREAAEKGPKAGRVIREWNFSNPKDVADWNKRHGLKPDAEPMGHTDDYFLRDKR
jgi:hypothetical protein